MNITKNVDGKWVPATPLEMTCEYNGCKSTIGKDYMREKTEHGWETEPIFLCDKHSGLKPKTTVRNIASIVFLIMLILMVTYNCIDPIMGVVLFVLYVIFGFCSNFTYKNRS